MKYESGTFEAQNAKNIVLCFQSLAMLKVRKCGIFMCGKWAPSLKIFYFEYQICYYTENYISTGSPSAPLRENQELETNATPGHRSTAALSVKRQN